MSQQIPRASIAPDVPGPVALPLFFAMIIDLYGLYAFTGLALVVFAFVIGTAILGSVSGANAANSAGKGESAQVFLFLSWACAFISGAVVGLFHWFQFKRPALLTLVFFAIAVVIWIATRSISAVWAIVIGLLTAATACAVIVLPPPPGSLDMEKKENQTMVVVSVKDPAGHPLNATVYADLKWPWRKDPPLEDDNREWWSKTETYVGELPGVATLHLQVDPRFKILVVRVKPDPVAETGAFGGRVEYEDGRAERAVPVPGTVQPFDFTLHAK